ncbi:unnamed protein product [Diatraea saccharalis]|uniref:Serpin domain-containing protein n=1 Tax=Diatraea saccharalis TaxID=40085 RepID=A0A9N9R8N9_9NEOP|nr:unnamed protein product [Diatraea saccharalis]
MSRFKLLFIISIGFPLVFSQCTKERAEVLFRRSVYEFSIDLLSRIAEDTDGHFVSSTLSPWSLLTTISLGATDETLAELKRVLLLHAHKCFNNKYLELVKQVTSTDSGATLERSSSLFIDGSMELKENFRQKITKTGVCAIKPLNFQDFNAAAAEINFYVKQATHGVVEDIVTPSDLEGVYLTLIDALYFKGTWTKSFSSADTEQSTFYDARKNAIGDVNLMFINSEFNMTSINKIRAKVLELPYGSSGRFSMLLFLPNDDVTVYNVIDSLKTISLATIFNLYKREGTKTVLVQIPRFKISSDLDNLKELLVDMGVRDAFDSARARFPDISDYQMYVSSFIQKADIEVTEEGTVAASATELGLSARTIIIPEEFVANKPFIFMVVDRLTEVPIFSGAYSTPTVY